MSGLRSTRCYRFQTKFDRSFFGTVGEHDVRIFWIRSLMYRDQVELIRIGFLSNFLHFVSLGILNKDNVFTAVVETADKDKLIKDFWLCLHGYRCHQGERISFPNRLIAVSLMADWNVVRSHDRPASHP